MNVQELMRALGTATGSYGPCLNFGSKRSPHMRTLRREDLEEYKLIQEKKSNLSSMNRKALVKRVEYLLSKKVEGSGDED